MSGFTIEKIDRGRWRVVDRRSKQEVGTLIRSDGSYRVSSEQFKMRAEAADPWLILRMVFNSEEFAISEDGADAVRLTPANIERSLGE